jgi:thiamine transport system substrate-binding protein
MVRRSLLLRCLAGVAAALGALVPCGPVLAQSQAATELRVITHNSFSLPKPLLARFEEQAGVKLVLVKGGDAGEVLNKLILTKARPIADVVYGLDNASVARAVQAGVLDDYAGPASRLPAHAVLGPAVVAVNVGHVTLNIDKAWFAKSGLAEPQKLEDLTLPAYRKLVSVPNPATSSPGFALLASSIAALGEEAAFDWWQRLRDNEVKVAKGWSEAYYTDFSRNGGPRPIVVSYATSPAAEVFYSKTPLTEAPTKSLSLRGAVFRQVEAVALVRGGEARAEAGRFIEFLCSPEVQAALQTSMWVLPADARTPRADVISRHSSEPMFSDTPSPQQLAEQGSAWIRRWTRTVLR